MDWAHCRQSNPSTLSDELPTSRAQSSQNLSMRVLFAVCIAQTTHSRCKTIAELKLEIVPRL